jgi:hypothetical protein
MRVSFRSSFVALLLAGVVLGGVGSSAEVLAGRLSVKVGGVCVREGARDKVAGKRVVCVLNVKKQLRWRLVKAKTVRVVTGTSTSTSVVSTSTAVASTTTTSTTTSSTSSTSTTTSSSSSSTTTTSVVGGDRTAPVVTLGRSTGSAVVATLTFTVTGNEPIRCSTLSSSEGVDFRFTRISRINSIVQTTEDVCTISVQSTAEPGDTNPRESSLAAASTFSVSDTAGNTQTTLSGSPQTIWVQRIARPVISLSATTETANLNAAINGYTVTSSGGTVASYSLTGTLPAGLSFSTTTGRITGTPTVTQTATTYTITATNTSGSTTATFTLTVVRTCASGGECIVGNTGPGGGIVFYVQADGGTFNCGVAFTSTCKYLEVAPSGWNTGADPSKLWAVAGNQSSDIATITNVDTAANNNNASGIGLGYKNSLAIVNQGNDTTTAAGAARAYGGGSKSDWYLPTAAELNLLCQWARNVTQSVTTACTGGTLNTGTGASGGFSAVTPYWSSSEVGTVGAWGQFFSNGTQTGSTKDLIYFVRPVRAFG